jgi:hypothetical protein
MNGLIAAKQTDTETNGHRYTSVEFHIFTKMFFTVCVACLSTTFLPALSQGVSTPAVRIETKQQVINQRQFGTGSQSPIQSVRFRPELFMVSLQEQLR